MPARRAPTSRVLFRYLRFHLPGLALVIGGLAAAVHWGRLPVGLAVAGAALWLLKDALLFPSLRSAYEPDGSSAGPRPIGELGVAVDEGRVQVGAELWRARAARGAPALRAGARVRVVAVDGLELEVEAAPDEP